MNKETHSLSLPTLHPITMTDWLPKLGEKAFLAWLQFHSWKPMHFSSETGILLPYSLNRMIRMLKVGKHTFYDKIIKPLKSYGLIQVVCSEYSGQETQIILYTYPHNQKEKAAKPLDLISPDHEVQISSTIPTLTVIQNQHTNPYSTEFKLDSTENPDDAQPDFAHVTEHTLTKVSDQKQPNFYADPVPDQHHPGSLPEPVPNQHHPNSHPEPVPNQHHPGSLPEPVPNQHHPGSLPEPVLNQHQPSSHSEPVPNQHHPGSLPELVLNRHHPGSLPEPVLNQHHPGSLPEPVLNQHHPGSLPEPVLNQHHLGSLPEPVLNQHHFIFKDLNNKDKKDKINKESTDLIHSLPEELQMTIKQDPLLEQRLDQILIAYHKSVSHPSYSLPFFLFKLKQCVHYHHDPERFASYLYKSLLNEWNKPQAPVRTQPSSAVPRTRPHDVPEWVWRQQHEPRQPFQEISPEDKAYAEYLLRALGEIE